MTNPTEKDLQTAVVDLARRHGWMAYHTFDSRRSAPGFPDLILVRGDRLLAMELKVGRRKLTGPQTEWLRAFARVRRVAVYLVRQVGPALDTTDLMTVLGRE